MLVTFGFVTKTQAKEDRFEAFWNAYPAEQRCYRGTARKLFDQRVQEKNFPKVMALLAKQVVSYKWQSGYVPGILNYLRGECWEDAAESYSLYAPCWGARPTRSREAAAQLRTKLGGCPHDPACAVYADCIDLLTR